MTFFSIIWGSAAFICFVFGVMAFHAWGWFLPMFWAVGCIYAWLAWDSRHLY
jgi:hypothetical protein